jgi:predicted metal-dependent HD superfamily phosphohydrolase
MPLLLPAEVAALFSQDLLERARLAYESAGRHYHTWAHIEACLRVAQGLRFDDAASVYAALLFHDAVYVPGARDNEARSADLATEELRTGSALRPAQIARVHHLILLTASHGALPADAPTDDKLLIDIDLSILAAAPEAYAQYAEQVRREWVPGVVSAAQYAQGRANFLAGMLTAPRVFHSNEFAAREAQARLNIAHELAALRGAV